jgi:hypothetical protein
MIEDSKKKTISNRCAPIAATNQQQQSQPRVDSLTQLGSGMAGREARILSCYPERQTDDQDNFQGEIIYPVIGDIQNDPRVAASTRGFEFRAAITIDGKSRLVYRKLPFAATGATNSWLTSAETAMHSLVETLGRVTSDRNAGVYRFERLNQTARVNNRIPDVDEMIDELLAEFVIESLGHPALQRLLNQSHPQGNQGFGFTTNAVADQEDNDEVY